MTNSLFECFLSVKWAVKHVIDKCYIQKLRIETFRYVIGVPIKILYPFSETMENTIFR